MASKDTKPFLASFPAMPPAVREIYDAGQDEAYRMDKASGPAEQFALARVNQAGWYVGAEGWKQLGPDVRDKMHIRSAVMQPNGKFTIEAVEVFYPNAAKSTPMLDAKRKPIKTAGAKGKDVTATRPDPFTLQRIRNIIANTNRSIATGAPRPSLTRRHPMKYDILPTTNFGACINFREQGEAGHVVCDLVDVKPEMVNAWTSGQVVGLSPGFNQDASGTNQRVGHVAALPKTQALSALPATALFESQTAQLCFSADEAVFDNSGAVHRKECSMPKSKEYHAAMQPHYGALSTAFAALAAGDPNGEESMSQAQQAFGAASEQYEAEHPDQAQDEALIDKKLCEHDAAAGQAPIDPAGDAAAGAGEGGIQAQMYSADDLAKMTDQQFDAECTENPLAALRSFRGIICGLASENQALKGAADRDKTRLELQTFCAEHAGQDFDAAEVMADFDAAGGSPAMATRLKDRITKSPAKKPSPSQVGQVFGSDATTKLPGISAGAAAAAKPPVQQDLAATARAISEGTGQAFGSDDLQLAGIASGAIRQHGG